MSDDKCELFTAKWMISSRLNAGVSLLGAADSNQRYAPRSIIKQDFPCKRQIYWISSPGGVVCSEDFRGGGHRVFRGTEGGHSSSAEYKESSEENRPVIKC